MKNKPLISIITPTYNHENFIGQCIESVLAQTYPHWEQIIIDDGSTDETRGIVNKYKDDRIKYIRQNHLGIWKLGDTYNKALQRSQGEFIAVLEGDDFWPPNKLERQIAAFESSEVILSCGKAAITNSKGRIIVITPRDFKYFRNKSKKEILRKLLFQNFVFSCTVICRKDALLSIGGFKQPRNIPLVDYPTWLELCLHGIFYPIDEIMGYYRQHEEQVSSKMILEMALTNEYSIDFFMRMTKEAQESIGVDINSLTISCQHRVSPAFFNLGRISLLEGKWLEADKNFRTALNKGPLRIKLMAIVGIICSCFRMKLKSIDKLSKRIHFKDIY